MTAQDYERLNSHDTFRTAAVFDKIQGNNIICAQDSNFALVVSGTRIESIASLTRTSLREWLVLSRMASDFLSN